MIVFLFAVAFCFLVLPAMALYYAWAVSTLWGWFAVPLGAPEVGIFSAWGLLLLVGMFKNVQIETKGEKDWKSGLMTWFFKPIFAVVFGYVLKTFLMGQ